MNLWRRLLVASMLTAPSFVGLAQGQEEAAPHPSATASLDLPAPEAAELQRAMEAHDYLTAEKILIAEINRDPRSAGAGRMLAYIGTVYYLNQDYLNAVIAWKKSDAITPLAPSLRFSLAMTYVRISHPEWARPVLDSLAKQFPENALFPYWLGRLEYDARRYKEAI
ncbi:MAG TPA: tetratricopeptide repeat protein, partial [Acidobacteriaceae bacterium]